uniref:Reverse transcriptase/retrotransposon-derived protein RNase H-like domain-containing protein n=1 Tax=Timema cristinae TaxID=61476 RepID=A0A7R9GT66_TIMCR|nr:unnamed protein product [Timema cristinae]
MVEALSVTRKVEVKKNLDGLKPENDATTPVQQSNSIFKDEPGIILENLMKNAYDASGSTRISAGGNIEVMILKSFDKRLHDETSPIALADVQSDTTILYTRKLLEILKHKAIFSTSRPLRRTRSATRHVTLKTNQRILVKPYQFLPKMNKLTAPRTSLVKANIHWRWSQETEVAFHQLKTEFHQIQPIKRPRLNRPLFCRQMTVGVDLGQCFTKTIQKDHILLSHARAKLTHVEQRFHSNKQ